MASLASTKAISHTYHFYFHPSDNYNNIKDQVAYGKLKTALTNGTMNFIASFANTDN